MGHHGFRESFLLAERLPGVDERIKRQMSREYVAGFIKQVGQTRRIELPPDEDLEVIAGYMLDEWIPEVSKMLTENFTECSRADCRHLAVRHNRENGGCSVLDCLCSGMVRNNAE
jgi:hypothetical protein